MRMWDKIRTLVEVLLVHREDLYRLYGETHDGLALVLLRDRQGRRRCLTLDAIEAWRLHRVLDRIEEGQRPISSEGDVVVMRRADPPAEMSIEDEAP